MYLDFIKTPFNNNPSMQKYSGDLISETPRSSYVEQKINEVSLYGSDLYGETELFKQLNLLEKVEEKLKTKKHNSIKDLSFQIEEDIAVMHKGKLEAISFIFPSGWIPSNALGRNLSFLHNPVADNELLIKSGDKLSRYMCKHTIQRWVWNVTTIQALSNHPKVNRPEIVSFEKLFFRLETQLSTPLDTYSSLFLVLVEVFPLSEVWDSTILDSINSMSENILSYKKLTNIKKYLNSLKF
tara:strand:- start:3439 stop:4158 length:720 start_codon:yes stop_codon:yes gene_type:complete